MQLDEWKSFAALFWVWIGIFILTGFGIWLRQFSPFAFWMSDIFLGFAIAGRQGALLQVVHENSHQLLSANPKGSRKNNFPFLRAAWG